MGRWMSCLDLIVRGVTMDSVVVRCRKKSQRSKQIIQCHKTPSSGGEFSEAGLVVVVVVIGGYLFVVHPTSRLFFSTKLDKGKATRGT